uniref:Uncharacterized protein n=1 Tax=Anguilla anguilla TaxID=7936 RepID=A0A0E9RJ43_ANGAN
MYLCNTVLLLCMYECVLHQVPI